MVQKTEKDFWVQMSIREIQTQIEFAEIAYSHIDPKAAASNKALFSSIHSFLSHCAMISKMLKAADDANPTQPIGGMLGVSDKSMIHERIFRNHLEHYDERLKKWIRQFGADANIGTYNIASKSMINVPNMVFVSNYDPSTKQFTFVNDDFDLALMFAETQRIKGLVDIWIEKVNKGQIVAPFL